MINLFSKFKMITKYLSLATGLLVAGAMLTGCQADIDAPSVIVPNATMTANISIAELKHQFDEVATVAKIGNRPDGTHYIVHGRVISCDASGNIYQTLVIQDETAALDFSIGRASLYNIYPVGQEVVVDLSGLYIGKYGGLQRIGDYYESGGEAQPGRMLYPKFANQSQLNGLPNTTVKYVKQNADYPSTSQYCIVTTFEELPSAGDELNNMMSQLVEFHNVHFEEGGVLDYAPYQETVNRVLVDQSGNKISVRNSGYSTFYNNILPEGEGTVRGILSYYGNTSDSPWQLLLRGEEDVIFSDKGKRVDPYTVAEVIAAQDNGMNAWMTGYIVGASRFGVSVISSAADCVFGNDGDIYPGNLLVAADPACTDPAQCVAIELPQGSRLREYGNLLDNPENLHKQILVNGSFNPYLGIHGLTDCPGTFADFEIEGLSIDAPEGLGTQDMPYTCSYVIANYDDASTAWVGGYVIGYVTGSDYASGLVFGLPDASADYGNQNVVIGPTADCTDPALCVVVRTSTKRQELGLKNNPTLFGKFLKVEGQMGTYLNRAAVTTINNYEY